MSFPVAGTLMVEPTESESLAEVDAFCEAMIAIRGRDRPGRRPGVWPADDNPLRGAPHTAECLLVAEWDHPYTREQAAYPLGKAIPAQGVAAGAPHRRRLRRPQPGVLVPAGGGVRVRSRTAVVVAMLVAGWCASAGIAHAEPEPEPPAPEPALPAEAPEPPAETPAVAPPAPKTSIDADGTYAVGTEIMPGTYTSAGPITDGACYWKRVNGGELLDNALSKKSQTVVIQPTDTAFTTNDCQPWQLTDAPPPPSPVRWICLASWARSSAREFSPGRPAKRSTGRGVAANS